MSRSNKARHGTECKTRKDTMYAARCQARARAKRKQREHQQDRAKAKRQEAREVGR
jgi:hypothetical protein